MNLRLNLVAALRSLLESPTRSALSALGITVGSMAIVLLISIAKGVQNEVQREVESLGVNLLIVLPTRIEEGQMFAPGLVGISYLSVEDMERAKKIDGIQRASVFSFVGTGLKVGKNASPTTLIIATKPEWFSMRKMQLSEGNVFDNSTALQPVCVIGSIAKKKLFPNEPALGKSITYNGRAFTVIGVTKDQEASNSLFSMGSFENVMYVSFDYFRSLEPRSQIDRIMLQARPDKEPRALVESVEKMLGERLHRETYSVLTQEDLLKLVFKLMEIMTWLLTGLTSIGLVVGGVGIMTIMLMSVSERRREIGIRKTVGARRKDVFQQFLAESSILGLIGGVCGLLISVIASALLAANTPIKPLITGDTIALSFLVSLGVGALFGIIPALKAAGKDPVESLRQE